MYLHNVNHNYYKYLIDQVDMNENLDQDEMEMNVLYQLILNIMVNLVANVIDQMFEDIQVILKNLLDIWLLFDLVIRIQKLFYRKKNQIQMNE